MKRFTFISLLIFAFALAAISQNQNGIVDDVYFNPKDQKVQLTNSNQVSPNQITENKQRPNYKNGAQEIIFKERNIKNPTILRDTVYVIGQASDYNTNSNNGDFNFSKWDGKTNPVILHDTIYVTDNLNDSVYISQDNNSNPDKGYYLNGFNGTESDKEYAERIRRFHNPKYSIFIGDPRYNDIYFLNSSDWNVYVDDSYAYVTPTWTNPYWWNYNYGPMGFGSYGFGWHSPYYGVGNIYNPWGYDNFYGYGGMYGYGNYWDLYGYGGYYGDYYGGYSGYGSYWSTSRNKNYNEGTRRSLATQNNESGRLNTGTRSGTSNAVINAGGYNSRGSGNAYTVVSGTNSNSNISSGVASRSVLNSNSRTISNQSNGIGVVRNNTNRNSGNYQSTANGYSFNRTENTNVNTLPRTYTTTTTGETNGNYISRGTNSSTSTFRGSSSSITRSVNSNTPSTYSNNSRNSYSESSSNSRSSAHVNSSQTNSSNSSYNSGNSGSSSNSSSSGSGRTNSSSSGRR